MNRDHAARGTSPVGEASLDINLGHIVPASPQADEPFCTLVLGDFSGHRNAAEGASPDASERARRPVLVDRDNFDDVLARFAPELRLSLDETGPEVVLRFQELEDFHPDRLYERLPLFRALRDLRKRLANPATFRAAARELWGEQPGEQPSATPEPSTAEDAPPAPGPVFSGGSLLDQIVGESPAAAPERPRDGLAEYIRRIVAPHALQNADPRQPEALAQLDAVISAQMRRLLHHPDFQALEALWRGVFFLVRRVETDEQLRLYLLDLSRQELAADLAPEHELQDTMLYRLLVESAAGTLGGTPWSLLIGHYTFGPRPEELRQLRRIGRLALVAGAPWIAAADARLIGCPTSFGEAPDPEQWNLPPGAEWEELRRSPEAAAIGLVLPRFLLRLPYGEEAEPCEHFEFEEMETPAVHEQYLWGNPALACALLLAQSFAAAGWSLRPGMHLDLGNLPLHLVREDAEVRAQPCAEALMRERAALQILEAGVMPLASMKDRDAVRLVRFQSIAHPLSALAGRWAAARAG
jgi:type VI secretion system protein ImpC